MLHIALHFLVPLLVALVFYRKTWRFSFLILMLGLLIDLDHLLANPIYDATRCSIGFHPLHTVIPIALYVFALFHPKTRLLALGLCLHIALDSIDCQFTNGVWYTLNSVS